MNKIKITWKKVEELCRNIETQLKLTKFEPDGIIAISRGGLIPGIILSHKLNINIATIAVRSYRKDIMLDRIESNWHIATNRKFRPDEELLIIDDVHEDGRTLNEVEKFIQKIMPHNKYKIATLYYKIKEGKESTPDYFAEIANEWICFPWERE